MTHIDAVVNLSTIAATAGDIRRNVDAAEAADRNPKE